MYLIKLSATSSTNDFLKKQAATTFVDNFTVVWADEQLKGKGQMGANWVTQGAKNLTFSVFLNDKNINVNHLFTLNVVVANAVLKALFLLNLTNIYVKWPNDILSYNKKIGGILIENNIQANGSITSVIGIGVNVEQTNFDGFPQASSIFNQYKIVPDKLQLLTNIVDHIKNSLVDFDTNIKPEWAFYHNYLFKKDIVSSFEDAKGNRFNGIIKEVNHNGQLVVEQDGLDLHCYNLKEIKLLY